eukprot:4910796-Prymnesium_polylepis.1
MSRYVPISTSLNLPKRFSAGSDSVMQRIKPMIICRTKIKVSLPTPVVDTMKGTRPHLVAGYFKVVKIHCMSQ